VAARRPCRAGAGVPTLDPEEACQQAIAFDMVVHRAHPLNCEPSISALVARVVMPNTRFYMRNNFGIPAITTIRELRDEAYRAPSRAASGHVVGTSGLY
jgi:hypothetical protein